MGTGILVCGCNGSGKSTLGKALAQKLNDTFMEIEDYYFPQKNADYPYDRPLTRDEAEKRLFYDIKRSRHFVLAAAKGDFGEDLTALYEYAVLIKVPKEIRMQRVKDRSFRRFGNRILPSGDLYEKEKKFFDMAMSRTENEIEEWLQSIRCPILYVDGTDSISDTLTLVTQKISKYRGISL